MSRAIKLFLLGLVVTILIIATDYAFILFDMDNIYLSIIGLVGLATIFTCLGVLGLYVADEFNENK
jgi:hypothetical protein